MNNLIIAISGGHTGGHIYPLIAIGNYLRNKHGLVIHYYGSENDLEYEVAIENNYIFNPIEPTQIRTKKINKLIKGIINLVRTYFKVKSYMSIKKPKVVLVSGGYTSAPVGLAAKTLGIPLIIFCPDVKPGWSIRFLSRFANKICCSVEESKRYLPQNKSLVTGYPVREEFYNHQNNNLKKQDIKTILIMGGSLGSKEINKFVAMNIESFTNQFKVIHISGLQDYKNMLNTKNSLNNLQKSRYQLIKYSKNIPELMASSDMVISRAGASILGELTTMHLPAILYPGKFADQILNARYLEENGAAIVVEELSNNTFEIIENILTSEETIKKLSDNMHKLSKANSINMIANVILEQVDE